MEESFGESNEPIQRSGAITGHEYEHKKTELKHRNVGDGGARAAVFGISDGLVTNVSLVLGVVGAHTLGPGVVELAGLAGLMGGAFSMAAGEYVSMKAQSELLARELEIERSEIAHYPEGEKRELVSIYRNRGIGVDLAEKLADHIMADPERALEAHAREELGIDPDSLGSPIRAAAASFLTFSIGALIPLFPFFLLNKSAAIVLAIVLSALAASVVGGVLGMFTGRSRLWSALRQLTICTVAGAITFGIGSLVGISGMG